jgi:ribonuclease BN (tRNA processing enzyme)
VDVLGNDFFVLNAAGSAETIDIYGPRQTKELVDTAFHYITVPFGVFAAEPFWSGAGMANRKFVNPFVTHEIEREGVIFQDDEISITAAENSHYALMPAEFRGQMKSYSYRVATPNGVIVFTGDTGPSDALTQLAKGADVLVSEIEDLGEITAFVKRLAEQNHWSQERAAAFLAHMKEEHLDLAEVGMMATRAGVKSVILYHYNPVNPRTWVAGVQKYFSGPVFAPADLDRFCLNRRSPQGGSGPTVTLCQQRPATHLTR